MQKKLFLALTLFALSFRVEAQAGPEKQPECLRIGYADVEYIFDLLPEGKKVKLELIRLRKKLLNQIRAKGKEYQQKDQAFIQGRESMTEAVRKKKELELQQLEEGLQQLQQEVEQKLVDGPASLLTPLYEKIHNTIEQVAKEQGYTYVFNANVRNAPVLLYVTEEHNISDLVLKKLGVKPNKEKGKK